MPSKTQTQPPAEPELHEHDTPAAIIERRVTHTETSLLFSEDTTFEEWQSAYAFYDRLHERGKWWLGDAIKWAEGHFPDRYTQAIEITGLSYSRLTTICSVCCKIEPSRRRKELPFSFHEAVAYIPYQKGDYLLDRAIKEHWSKDELSDAVARSQGEPTRAERAAAKTSGKSSKTAAKIAASGKQPELAQMSEQLPPNSYVWNGYQILTAFGHLYTGTEIIPESEEDEVARSFNFANVADMATALEHRGLILRSDTPPEAPAPSPDAAKTQEAPTPPSVLPMPPATAQAPAPAQIEPDQHLAEQRCASALNILAESIKAVDWSLITPLRRKTWLKNLIVVDELIDLLQKP